MATNSFHFNIGKFNALVIKDSVSLEEWGEFFPTVKRAELQQTFQEHGFPTRSVMEIMCLLVKAGKRLILIDTGWGTRLQVNRGSLLQILQEEGIQPPEIDTVINSHGHPDHIGGNTDDEGKPAFPNARYVISRKEWDFWTSGPQLPKTPEGIRRTMLDAAQKHLLAIKDRFELIEDESEILPGFDSFSAPGHSQNQIGLAISSGKDRLLCTFDVAHHPLQFVRPSWTSPFDLIPEQAEATRRQILTRRLTPETQVFGCHFPFPGLGRVIGRRDARLWQPRAI